MSELNDLYQDFLELVKDSFRILIISHRKPDGDTLGAACVLKMGLQRNLGKEQVTLACIDEVGERFKFIPGVDAFVRDFGDLKSYDLVIVVDCGAHYMTKYHETYPELLSGKTPLINIDHHASNDMFGSLNIVDEFSASATVIIYKMFKFLGWKISADMATGLLAGLYNDTGSFMHSNTDKEVYDVSADLVALGANFSLIAKSIFKTNPVSTLKVWGRALDRVQLTEKGFLLSVVTAKDLQECGADSEDLSGVVDVLNSVPNSNFTAMISEDGKGNVKGSFRTNKEEVDLLPIVEKLGGGGHRKAAGFTIKGSLAKKEVWILNAQDHKEAFDLGEIL
jgi:phosphoesterase RecJ-like protein